jgi:hypothetical protein
MKRTIKVLLAVCAICATQSNAQVSISGQVREMTGPAIKGATVRIVHLNLTAMTDDSGFYNFSNVPVRFLADKSERSGLSILSRHGDVVVTLDRSENVSARIVDMTGRLVFQYPEQRLPPGSHSIGLSDLGAAKAVYLLQVAAGDETRCAEFVYSQKKITGFMASTNAALTVGARFAKTLGAMAADSMVVTHPNYWGGLDCINTRKISSTTGVQNYRMFSNDTTSTGWFASQMNFVFTPSAPGAAYYKRTVPDYVFEARQTQREIEQCIWRLPSEVPSSKRYSTYNLSIDTSVPSQYAAWTSGNNMEVNAAYALNQSWWELLGMEHHEMTHSYQPWYTMAGVTGFGESMADGLRALCGFLYWPAGSRCSGGVNQSYQGGAKYLYYIELKHPGFIYGLYKSSSASANFPAAVKQVTGESLDSLCKQCETQGMPYTLSRGAY